MGTVTPVDEYAGTITFPDNGDDLEAPDVEAVIQILANRGKHLLDATAGLAVWGWKLRVAPGGAASGNTGVFVPMIEALNLLSGTSRYAERLSGETQLTTADHFGGGTLANSTWYYVYAKISASALALEISLDAPEAGLVWKGGAGGTHRYIGCFRTDSSGVPIPMQMARGRYHWSVSDIGATALRVLTAGASGSYADVSLASLVPPHAKVVQINAYLDPAGTAGGAAMRKDGAAGAGTVSLSCGSSVAVDKTFEIECSATQVVEYRITSGASTVLYLDVLGFSE